MKTKEELTALKAEVETLNKKLAELSEDELAAVAGGAFGEDGRMITGDRDRPAGNNGAITGNSSVPVTGVDCEFGTNRADEGGHIFDIASPKPDSMSFA